MTPQTCVQDAAAALKSVQQGRQKQQVYMHSDMLALSAGDCDPGDSAVCQGAGGPREPAVQ
jgi:hypothetical protein